MSAGTSGVAAVVNGEACGVDARGAPEVVPAKEPIRTDTISRVTKAVATTTRDIGIHP